MKKYLIFILIILILFGVFIWQSVFSPVNLSGREVIFSIEKGESSKEISVNLEKEGLIRWGPAFRAYVYIKGVSKKLQAGTYQFSTKMNIPAIVNKFIEGDVIKIKVTIPEGFDLKQIKDELSQSWQRTVLCQFPAEDFKTEFDFLSDVPKDASLEGFLFPDTYYFLLEANCDEITRKFLTNFDKKITADLREEIRRQRKTIFEIITTASLIEKEVKTKEDKEIVSGVLWKRLKIGMPLQVDATISYITGKKTTEISINETKIDSPYNTYKYRGLPAGPICNPGIESIGASLYPKDSDYLYYLSIPDGRTIFSKTLEEHNIAKAKYLW